MSRRGAPAALAALLLLAAAAQAQDFRRTAVPGKPLCLYWPVREYRYHYDAAGSARTPGDSELAAMEAAFDSWRALSATCSDFQLLRGEDLQAPAVGYVGEGGDNLNVLTFRERSCDEVVPPDDECFRDESCAERYRCWSHNDGTLALTTTTFSFRTGAILDADIEFNAGPVGGGPGFLFTTVDGPPCEAQAEPTCVAIDLQNTLTHELGHVMGLDHVASPGATMEPTAPPGETRKRILDDGTAAGFCGVYPRGRPSLQCVDPDTVNERLVARGAGLSGLGCASAGGLAGPSLLLVLLGLLRRRSRARPPPAGHAARADLGCGSGCRAAAAPGWGERVGIAFFDLDKTLIAVNSGSLWIRRELALRHITRLQALRAGAWLARYHLGFVSMEDALLRAIRQLAGTRAAPIVERTGTFYAEQVRALYRPGALEALERHRCAGDACVLLTSSSGYLSELVARDLRLDAVLCNRFEVDAQGLHTGRALGGLCFGSGKLAHAEAYLREHHAGRDLQDCAFYTDSYSDLPVLAAVGRPVAVNPDPRLRREALRRGWPVVDWGRPVAGQGLPPAPSATAGAEPSVTEGSGAAT